MRRKVVHAPLEVDRIVAHVRGGVEAYDPDRRDDETGQIERPPMVPGDRGPEGDAHERGNEAVRLRRLEPGPEGGHLFPDRLSSREDANFNKRQWAGPRIDHGVFFGVYESGHRPGPDIECLAVRDHLSFPFNEIENLRVSVTVGRRLHPRIHPRQAHEHEVAVVRPHDLLVYDSGANSLLPRLLWQVSHDRSHGPTPWCAHGRDISISMITCNHASAAGDDQASLRGPRTTRRRPRGVLRPQPVRRAPPGVRVPAAGAGPPRARPAGRSPPHGRGTRPVSSPPPPSVPPPGFRDPPRRGW